MLTCLAGAAAAGGGGGGAAAAAGGGGGAAGAAFLAGGAASPPPSFSLLSSARRLLRGDSCSPPVFLSLPAIPFECKRRDCRGHATNTPSLASSHRKRGARGRPGRPPCPHWCRPPPGSGSRASPPASWRQPQSRSSRPRVSALRPHAPLLTCPAPGSACVRCSSHGNTEQETSSDQHWRCTHQTAAARWIVGHRQTPLAGARSHWSVQFTLRLRSDTSAAHTRRRATSLREDLLMQL